jgi:hypothetical protein
VIAGVSRQDLDRDRTTERELFGLLEAPYATPADRAEDAVVAKIILAQPREMLASMASIG